MDGRCRAPRAAGIPETVGFLTKPEIALEQIRAACAAGLPRGVVLMDAGYGTNTRLREEIRRSGAELCRRHPAADLGVAAGDGTAAAAALVGSRPSPKLMRRDAEHHPVRSRRLRSACRRQAGRRFPGARERPAR